VITRSVLFSLKCTRNRLAANSRWRPFVVFDFRKLDFWLSHHIRLLKFHHCIKFGAENFNDYEFSSHHRSSSYPPTAHWTSTGLPSRTSYHPALCFSSSVIFLSVDACVGLNWLLVSFLSHVNKNIHSFIYAIFKTAAAAIVNLHSVAIFDILPTLCYQTQLGNYLNLRLNCNNFSNFRMAPVRMLDFLKPDFWP